MKKYFSIFTVFLLVASLFVGCKSSNIEETPTTTIATEVSKVETETAETENIVLEPTEDLEGEENFEYEVEASTHYIENIYAEQIQRYYNALSEKWEEGKYFENDLSALASYYYEGNPLENVGFGFQDLNNDGYWELIIGAIFNADNYPIIFEIWTLVDDEPVMVAQSGSRNRYYLNYTEEDNLWTIVNEGENGAASHGVHYLTLDGDKLNVAQAVILDAMAYE